ncbi:MAG: Unknown protein [uncultured Sulfurovum sp.]|uniref:Caspase family p20 domain-containing protein n=1 Tax=uncultured Sulfurovum sp. TaxID=269237 RepID=A0A6S6TYC7_9BACT|nr:MAG: Unknown protein [uncultured Sulfurovum sp.]
MRILLLISMFVVMLTAQNREALLIGNSNYEHISNLNDTSSNLSRLKTTLENLAFTVNVKNNLEAKKLKQAIDNFRDCLARNRDTIGFLYYSGHGCQMDNVGYLIPTNVNSSKKLDVQYDALNIDKMLETLKEAGNRVNMLFLDACRDNTPTGTKGGKKGLAQAPLTPKGTLVVYATEATKTADDNNNFINSLIAQIEKPNKSIRDIGYNISDDVASQTREHQVPQVFAQRVPKIFLKHGGGGENHSMQGITKMNGIMYQNQAFSSQDKANYDAQKNGGRVWDWQGAKNYCQGLTLGNYTDWRLPNREELQAVGNIEFYHAYGDYKTLDEWKAQHQEKSDKYYHANKHKRNSNSSEHKYFVKKAFLENMPPLTGKYKNASFWSSTERDSSRAWVVLFHDGNGSWLGKAGSSYALCVR